MGKYLDILAIIVIGSFLISTMVLPINYMTTTITDLGLFLETPILHHVLASSIFFGGAVVMTWESIKKRSTRVIRYLFPLIMFMMTGLPLFEWLAFWELSGWTLKKLIKRLRKNGKQEKIN